jgi:NAD(P)-dependent dehydrogenase (short-subunit alcohol dehydrogenase family)
MQADMSQVTDARHLVRDTFQHFARLDILVNNAAISLNKTLAETTGENFDQIFALNTEGPYFAMQEASKVIAVRPDREHLIRGYAPLAFLGRLPALEQRRQIHEGIGA